MATYKGEISGIGNTDKRINEITGDKLAVFRNFVVGYKDGVLKYDNHDFDYSVSSNTVSITDGMCFAYGYFAYCFAKDFTILPPTVENYFIIYVCIDRSVIPNIIEIEIKNNYASPNIGINSFRQDVLSTVKTGVYEIPLWIFKVTNKGVDTNSFKDLRNLREKIQQMYFADNATNLNNGGSIGANVTCPTYDITVINDIVASTKYVQNAIKAEIDK